jgi:hypothetical protein
MPGRYFCFCASLPKWMSVGPSSVSPMWPMRPGPPARTYSSLKITSSIKGTPRPPALLGQPTQFQPAAPITRFQSMRRSTA